MKKRVTVLGEGAWGSALSFLFARNGYEVVLWCHHQEVAKQIAQDRINQTFFPRHIFDKSIRATSCIEEAMRHAMLVVEAIPVVYLRTVIEKARPFFHQDHVWVITSKGIEKDTLKLPSQIVSSVLGDDVKRAVVLGPTFATELVEQSISAFDVAVTDPALFGIIKELFENEFVSCFEQVDFIGMQLCAAFKNLIAIGVGFLKGSHAKENTCAFFVASMMQEIAQLLVACKGSREILFCVSGIGDIVLTSLGSHSKNMQYGMLLAQKKSDQEIAALMPVLPEGVNTAFSVQKLAHAKGVLLPICGALAHIIEGKADILLLYRILLQSKAQ